MTDRGMTSLMMNELAGASIRTAHLLAIDFQPYVYLTDYTRDLVWNGALYLPSSFLAFSDIRETSQLLVDKCTVGLSGVDQSIVAILLQDSYFRRRAKVWKACVDESHTVIADPVLVVDGHCDRPIIMTDPESGTCEASLDIVNMWGKYAAPVGRHTNHAEQQFYFPGDLGFQYVTSVPVEIFWGAGHVSPFQSTRAGSGGGGRGYGGGGRLR